MVRSALRHDGRGLQGLLRVGEPSMGGMGSRAGKPYDHASEPIEDVCPDAFTMRPCLLLPLWQGQTSIASGQPTGKRTTDVRFATNPISMNSCQMQTDRCDCWKDGKRLPGAKVSIPQRSRSPAWVGGQQEALSLQ